MAVDHPEGKDVARFACGETSAGENRWIVRQLFAVYGLARTTPRPAPTRGRRARRFPLGAGAYDAVIDRNYLDLAERADDLERELAPRLGDRLASLPAAERKAAIRRDRSYHSWTLCEWLIERCHQLVYEETAGAEEMADCAVTVAEELDPSIYSEGLLRDIQARAWAAVAEVLRITSDLRGSEEAFAVAEALVSEGTGDALEEGWILERKATLRRDQQRSAEAHRLLDEVVSIYRQYRDFHLVGRAFVQKGRVFGASGEEAAIHWLRRAWR